MATQRRSLETASGPEKRLATRPIAQLRGLLHKIVIIACQKVDVTSEVLFQFYAFKTASANTRKPVTKSVSSVSSEKSRLIPAIEGTNSIAAGVR